LPHVDLFGVQQGAHPLGALPADLVQSAHDRSDETVNAEVQTPPRPSSVLS
jgi:hypothetical protein